MSNKQPTHVAIDIHTWKKVMEFLEEKHTMKEVEAFVVGMRNGVPCNPEPAQEQPGLKAVGDE